MIVERYMADAFLPSMRVTTVSEVTFVAGPAKRKTRAAPGESPFSAREATMGVLAVAHT